MMRVAARKTLYCVATSFLLTSVVNPAGFTPRFSRITLCEAARDIPSGKDKKGDTLSFEQWFAKLKSDDSNNDEKMDDFKKMVKGELQDGSLKGVRELFESGVPKEVGYGFLMGYSSGFCIKKVSRVVAVLVGGAFIFIQSLSYAGYIKVDHEKLQRDVEGYLDLNNDGKIDEQDLAIAQEKMKSVLTYNMPSGGGFMAGLVMGLRG